METITQGDFVFWFMAISEKLTIAELRLLYLLITEPQEVEFMSQMELANKLHVNRRTINIGLKRLKEYNYIREDTTSKKSESDSTYENVPKRAIGQAKKLIIEMFIEYYGRSRKNVVVNEDFFCYVLGDLRIHNMLRYRRDFVGRTIKESLPGCKLHYNRKKEDYPSTTSYRIISKINNEIINSRPDNRYYIDKNKLFTFLFENFEIDEVDVLAVINSEFPRLTIRKNRIELPKPTRKFHSKVYHEGIFKENLMVSDE